MNLTYICVCGAGDGGGGGGACNNRLWYGDLTFASWTLDALTEEFFRCLDVLIAVRTC